MELKHRSKMNGGVMKNDEHVQCNFASFDNIAVVEHNGQLRA